MTGNVSIQTEACSCYAKALSSLHGLLQSKNVAGSANTIHSIDDVVCAPIMMCYFEIMASTSPLAWIQHVEAAAMLLENRGLKNCSHGLEHQMFLTVRLFMVTIPFVSIV